MSESATTESATTATTEVKQEGEKKTRKVLTPKQILELEGKRAEKQAEKMKRARIQKSETMKRKNKAIVMLIAEKFDVKVKDIDLNFVEKLVLEDDAKNSNSKVDENQLNLGQVISNLFPQKSMSADDMFNEVSLWKNAYDVLSNQLREYAKIQKDEYGQTHFKFTSEMIPRLQTFLKTQDTNGNNAGYYSNAMHGQRNNRTEASEEKKT